MSYGAARDYIILKVELEATPFLKDMGEKEMNRMKESINLVLNLRHSFQHWGLPNRMRDLWYGCDPAKFDGMLDPNIYPETKKIFLEAEKLLPQPYVIISS